MHAYVPLPSSPPSSPPPPCSQNKGVATIEATEVQIVYGLVCIHTRGKSE